MTGQSLPDDYYTTLDELEDDIAGSEMNAPDRHFKCDFCSKGVPYSSNPRVGHYFADDVVYVNNRAAKFIREQGTLASLATYCEECTHRLLYFPHEPTTEIRVLTDLDEDKVVSNVEFSDVSSEGDGIPWDPVELQGRLGVDTDLLQKAISELIAPENVVTFFMCISSNIDIRELFNPDGTIKPKPLGRARREFDDLLSNRGEVLTDKKKFTDHVRGDS